MKSQLRTFLRSLGAASAMLATTAQASEAPPAPAPSTAVVQQTPRPALWKVADEDTTIYLFGTIHLLQGETTWFTPAIAAALASSDQLVTEVRPGGTGQKEAEALFGKAILPAGGNLRSMMSPEDRTAYEAALEGLDMPANAFDAFQPWYAGMILSLLPLIKEGYDSEKGVESVLTARKAPKTTTGELETMQFQLELFATLPNEQQLSYLRSVVDTLPDMNTLIEKMVDDWEEGDADALAALINDPKTDPALLERLLYARNARWADWITERMKQPGTVFVAVGAGHLAGRRSVQDELVQRGITSTRVQ